MLPKARAADGGMKGFTLIELLVVIAIIALLVSILLPSLSSARKQAQAAACMANLDQINVAVRMYQDEYKGWFPQSYNNENDYAGSIWSEAAWWVMKKDLWFYKICPKYLANPNALICPGDPYRAQFDFNKAEDTTTFACGYGFNYLLRHYDVPNDPYDNFLLNSARYGPKRPPATILMAEVGPDDGVQTTNLNASKDLSGVGRPWRDGGRMIWDDGIRGWYAGPTWLTARHLGKINMAPFDLSVRRVPTVWQLTNRIQTRYRLPFCSFDCYGLNSATRTYTCFLCSLPEPHYTFADSGLWWWTGKPPTDP